YRFPRPGHAAREVLHRVRSLGRGPADRSHRRRSHEEAGALELQNPWPARSDERNWPRSSRGFLLQGRQYFLYLRPLRFKKRWQLERLAQGSNRFVHSKTRDVRGDLEQNAARFAEIDRTEIITIALLGMTQVALCHQFPRHLGLLSIVGGAKCDVMNRA